MTDLQRFYIALFAFAGGIFAAVIGYLDNVRTAKKEKLPVPAFDWSDFSLKVVLSFGGGLLFSLGLAQEFGYQSAVQAFLGAAGLNTLLPKTTGAL